jgi:hypothetical protein
MASAVTVALQLLIRTQQPAVVNDTARQLFVSNGVPYSNHHLYFRIVKDHELMSVP